MRYWQHNETGRLLRIDLQMASSNWTEITEEQYIEAERIKDAKQDNESPVLVR